MANKSIAYNMDCMEYMQTVPDKYFDLAVVDPPYGDADGEFQYEGAIEGRFGGRFEKYQRARTGGTWAAKYGTKMAEWDKTPPPEYFEQLFRISKNQIIWGGNYFSLPPTRCFLIWHKTNIPENFTMSQVEYAWCSFNENAKLFECSSQNQSGRFHPTQKPVALYAWIFSKYAKPGYKILDTHLGSGSSRIAAYDADLEFVGCEIDKEYFDKQEKRFEAHSSQMNLFL